MISDFFLFVLKNKIKELIRITGLVEEMTLCRTEVLGSSHGKNTPLARGPGVTVPCQAAARAELGPVACKQPPAASVRRGAPAERTVLVALTKPLTKRASELRKGQDALRPETACSALAPSFLPCKFAPAQGLGVRDAGAELWSIF